MDSGPLPRRAIELARISDARKGDTHGVDGQVPDLDLLAGRLGWQVGPRATHVIVENDVSAYKRRLVTMPDGRRERRPHRPQFWEALAMLRDGRADGLIAVDLDRACRDPRDLEDLIDVVESSWPRIPVESLTGTLRLMTTSDISMARMLVAVANKASADTARRVADARRRQAEQGKWGGGKRPFGFGPDGITVDPGEAAEIRRAADAILAGVSLRQVTASLRDRGVPSVTGAKWDTQTVRGMLLRPRNAGLMVYRPNGGRGPRLYTDADITGKAPWGEILREETWRAVRDILTDPARRVGPGNTPRWLGSRIYRCGICGDGSTLVASGSTSSGHRYFRYFCREKGHLARAAIPCDTYVGAVVTERLARPNMATVLAPPAQEGADPVALEKEAGALRERLNEQARLHALGVIDGQQLAEGTASIRSQLDPVQDQLKVLSANDVLQGIAGNPDAARLWAEFDLGRKRAILRKLVTVTVFPAATRGRTFDYETVVFGPWHQG